jgi:hypothetical protein
MREKLLTHARESVQPAAAKKKLDAAYARAAALVRPVIEKKYPAKDMAVLAKYGCTTNADKFKLQSPAGAIREFRFESDACPNVANNRSYGQIYLADDRAFSAVEAWEAALDAYNEERRKRLAAFETLIRSSAHVEDVIEVWPEAAEVIPARELVAPIAPEQIAIIKADMRERKAA